MCLRIKRIFEAEISKKLKFAYASKQLEKNS